MTVQWTQPDGICSHQVVEEKTTTTVCHITTTMNNPPNLLHKKTTVLMNHSCCSPKSNRSQISHHQIHPNLPGRHLNHSIYPRKFTFLRFPPKHCRGQSKNHRGIDQGKFVAKGAADGQHEQTTEEVVFLPQVNQLMNLYHVTRNNRRRTRRRKSLEAMLKPYCWKRLPEGCLVMVTTTGKRPLRTNQGRTVLMTM